MFPHVPNRGTVVTSLYIIHDIYGYKLNIEEEKCLLRVKKQLDNIYL